jgi:hypothetical protein
MQHQDVANLAWHLICLFFQLSANFSLLHVLDGYIFGERWLSGTTALIWAVYLGNVKECPLFARLCSLICIAWVYMIVPSLSSQMEGVELYVYGAFGIVWMVQAITNGSRLTKDAITIAALLLIKATATYFISLRFKGALSEYSTETSALYLAGMVLLSMRQNSVKEIVFTGTICGHILSILINEPAVYLHSLAFVALMLQGLAHELSGEVATLLKLQDESNQEAKIRYEWAHVTFFPNVLFQACYETYKIKIKGSRRKKGSRSS